MSRAELLALAPVLVLATAAVFGLATLAWRRGRDAARRVLWLSAAGQAAALAVLPRALRDGAQEVGSLLQTDGLYHLMTAVLVLASLACTAFADARQEQLDRDGARRPEAGELHVLLLLAAVGALVLAGSSHFASLFLGLELLSVSLYGLVGYDRGEAGLEAALKYLLLAAASSAFLLMGGALLYAAGGSLELGGAAALAEREPLLAAAGGVLIFVAAGFKLALVPFHLWTPDVYQGAPVPAAAFVASVSKLAVFALVLRWSGAAAGGAGEVLLLAAALVAAASMIAGNLLALQQPDLKRLLAYSSIAHLGYLMVAVAAGGALAETASLYYAAAYAVSVLLAFAVITATSTSGEAATVDSHRGLFWRRPWLAAALTASLLSLAGIPLTGGFVGKFLVAAAAVAEERWTLALLLVLTSAIGLFYALRVIATLFDGREEAEAGRRSSQPDRPLPLPLWMTLVVLGVLLLVLGLFPAALLRPLDTLLAAEIGASQLLSSGGSTWPP